MVSHAAHGPATKVRWMPSNREMERTPELKVTIPNIVDDDIINQF